MQNSFDGGDLLTPNTEGYNKKFQEQYDYILAKSYNDPNNKELKDLKEILDTAVNYSKEPPIIVRNYVDPFSIILMEERAKRNAMEQLRREEEYKIKMKTEKKVKKKPKTKPKPKPKKKV